MNKKKKLNLIQRIQRFIKEQYYLYTNNFKEAEPVFIVGCGHSGTTLMLRILGAHPDLYAIDYETKAFQGNYPKMSNVLKWNKIVEEQGCRWVEKTPSHIRYIKRILKLFPKGRIIVMLRDGRDVTVSIRQRYGDSKWAQSRWIKDNQEGLKYFEDKRILPVRLEDLTSSTEKTLLEVCDHINVPYSPELLDYHTSEFKYHNEAPKQTSSRKGHDHLTNRVWQVNQPIFKDTSKWKTEATEEELNLFEDKEFKDLLKKFEYLD